MPVSVMQWRMKIGKFYNYSTKNLKGVKHNSLNISLKIKSFLILIIFFYTLINFILRFTLFVCYYPLYQCFTILKETFIVLRNHLSNTFVIFLVYLLYHIRLIKLSGDIEPNPGPKPSSSKNFSICHWNLNSIAYHDFFKVKLLTAYNLLHNIDIIGISESYLNSENFSSDNNLNITGYNMIRADHPSRNRRGGVCIYYKESLPIKMLDINYLQECICFDLKIGNKLCSISSLYRSPSQRADEFDNFLNN